MRIKSSAQRLIEMIESASKFSKLEDTSHLVFEKINLEELLSKVLEEFKPLFDEKNIKVEQNFEKGYRAEVSTVIEDVFSNLISNAVKYNPKNSLVRIEITERNRKYLVSFADEAEKIAKENRHNIFERFKRVGKGGVKGSGLGLAIVKRIMDLHHGKVWVEDNPGGGNIFIVEIPKKRWK